MGTIGSQVSPRRRRVIPGISMASRMDRGTAVRRIHLIVRRKEPESCSLS